MPVGVPEAPVTLTEKVTEAPMVALLGAVRVTVGVAGATTRPWAAETLAVKLVSPG